AERLARFAEYFDDAERMLLRLALAESEPHIGNNATHIWRQLFRIVLSGTEVPFPERLARLERRLLSGEEAVPPLAFGAFKELFNPFPRRMEGHPVVAGRITPPDWRPRSEAEYRSCRQAVVALLCRLATASDPQLAGQAHDFLVAHVQVFLAE